MDGTEPVAIGDFVQSLRNRLRSDERNRNCLVRGEIRQWKSYPSGHTYFSLRDDNGQISAVIWKGRCRIPSGIEEGQEVIVLGNVDIYAGRGQLQLIVERIEPIRKIGALEQERQKLLARLQMEGVLDREKKPLPLFPKHLAIITGADSAALADMLRLSETRWPDLRRTVIGVTVQGDRAVEEITRGLAVARHLSRKEYAEQIGIPPIDVVIVGRGGGSPEDLWAFNLEPVARALSTMPIPVISAVGHESDLLVSDVVADIRASTPSHAIELAVPILDDVLSLMVDLEDRLHRGSIRRFGEENSRLQQLQLRLRLAPSKGLDNAVRHLERLGNDLNGFVQSTIQTNKQRLAMLEGTLLAAHPQRVLERGYLMTTNEKGEVVAKVADLTAGETVSLHFADGTADANIDNIQQREE
ncbi:MAG: exodeoxyribonuclease VII large subunit [Euryarchaeota archaeon]|nr:exodeoxyribonuclease VII large subunit [Euryarchaeota archaeon]